MGAIPRDVFERVNALLPAAATGDRRAVGRLREVCDAHPGMYLVLGDLAQNARDKLIGLMAGENAVLADAFARKAGQLRRDLSPAAPTPIEALLIERVQLCWLHLQQVENGYIDRLRDNQSIAWGEYQQRRLDRAQARYLASLKALAQVQRLRLPAVQVNIAEAGGQQINVAGG